MTLCLCTVYSFPINNCVHSSWPNILHLCNFYPFFIFPPSPALSASFLLGLSARVHFRPIWNSSYCITLLVFFNTKSQILSHKLDRSFCLNITIYGISKLLELFQQLYPHQMLYSTVHCVLNLSEPTRRRRLRAVIRKGWTMLWITSAESFVWCCTGQPLTPPTCRRRRALWPSSRSPSAHEHQGQCFSSHYS